MESTNKKVQLSTAQSINFTGKKDHFGGIDTYPMYIQYNNIYLYRIPPPKRIFQNSDHWPPIVWRMPDFSFLSKLTLYKINKTQCIMFFFIYKERFRLRYCSFVVSMYKKKTLDSDSKSYCFQILSITRV